MPKPAVVGRAPRRRRSPRPAELPSVVEGQIAELCRDLTLEVKQMRRLESQADELRLAVQEWLDGSEPDAKRDIQLTRTERR